MRASCDYHGTCKNKAYKEVYRSLLEGKYKNKGWSYLCRKHFLSEQKRFKGKLPYSGITDEIDVIYSYPKQHKIKAANTIFKVHIQSPKRAENRGFCSGDTFLY